MIFVSYSWRDQSVIRDLEGRLRDLGLPVWVDYRNLRPDFEIATQLDLAIRDCQLFLAIQGLRHAPSAWVRQELLLARTHGKRVLRFTVVS